MSVSIDTMTLIWGLKKAFEAKDGNPRQVDLKQKQYRARVLLDILGKGEEKIILASVATAELLIGVPSDKHSEFLAEMMKQFDVRPFDLAA